MDTKKLRQKILDLAIHGKLVPQDPNDEPASVLLERIRAEKERLVKEGKIKKSAKSASSSSDRSHYENVPFEVPEGWCWTTIGEVSSSILYGVSESAKESGGYKLLRITDIQDNKVNWDSVPYTDFDEDKVLNYLLQDGDILFARTGATVGKSYLVSNLKTKSIYASYLIRVQTPRHILPGYIKQFFESGYYWEQISLSSVGIGQPNVNGTTLSNLNVPIPPYNEQVRIVEETNRWLELADVLDDNSEYISKSIDSTKSKILDLAIHGKLVCQDPSDEPASELLKRINPKSTTSCDNPHYENVPRNWVVTKLGEVAQYINGRAFNPEEWEDKGMPIIRIQNLNDPEAKFNYTKEIFDPKYLIRKCDLLFAWAASLGAYIWDGPDAWLNQHIFKVEPFDFLTKEYLYIFFQSMINSFYNESHGSGMVHITRKVFENIDIAIPPIKEQIRIVNKVQDLFNSLDAIGVSLY